MEEAGAALTYVQYNHQKEGIYMRIENRELVHVKNNERDTG
jgi:hypothetical protein